VWKEFGIDGHKESLSSSVRHPMADGDHGRHDEDRLYFFSDYVHLFKCVRNNLSNAKSFKVNSFSFECITTYSTNDFIFCNLQFFVVLFCATAVLVLSDIYKRK
jgi:hypothetical protein